MNDQQSSQNPYAPVRRKCMYWRERLSDEDRWDTRIKPEDRRVECTCFVEGFGWSVTVSTLPEDCPERRRCRYYIRTT